MPSTPGLFVHRLASRGPKSPDRSLVVPIISFLLALSLPAAALGAVTLTDATGAVEARTGAAPWKSVSQGYALSPGEELRTGAGSRAVLTFEDGSKVEIGPKGEFQLESSAAENAAMRFNFGALRAWVTKALTRHFTVRTPTAVCSVRGTEFGVEVNREGATAVSLFKGLLAIGDQKGNEVLIKEGQHVQVDRHGIGQVTSGKAAQGKKTAAADKEKLREALKREVGLHMSKEEVQAAVAEEQKTAVYKLGKALIDVNGNRVRLDDYIIKGPNPQVNLGANEFKLVVLNERVDRFDYFFYKGTFNRTLPGDISIALNQIQGQPFKAPDYFLTSYQTGRSNTADSVTESATGGHVIDVNNDGVAGDAVSSAYNPATNSVAQLNLPKLGTKNGGNDSFFAPIFDNYALAFNGVTHVGHTLNAGVLPYNGAAAFDPANLTGAQSTKDFNNNLVTQLVSPPNCADVNNCTGLPDPGKLHLITYEENAGGTVWDRFDNYIITDQGTVGQISDFAGLSSGPAFLSLLQRYNYEQIITASEFGGRKIDLVFEPKVLIQSGLIH